MSQNHFHHRYGSQYEQHREICVGHVFERHDRIVDRDFLVVLAGGDLSCTSAGGPTRWRYEPAGGSPTDERETCSSEYIRRFTRAR